MHNLFSVVESEARFAEEMKTRALKAESEKADLGQKVRRMRELQRQYKEASDRRCFPDGLYDRMRAAEREVDAVLWPPKANNGPLFDEK